MDSTARAEPSKLLSGHGGNPADDQASFIETTISPRDRYLLVYSFLQRYFIDGALLGAIKE